MRSLSHIQSGSVDSGRWILSLICFAVAIFSKDSQAFNTRVSSCVDIGLMSKCPVSQLNRVSMSFRSLNVLYIDFMCYYFSD